MIDSIRMLKSVRRLKRVFGDETRATQSIGEVEEILTRLACAEKDAARYRWLRDLPDGSCHEEIGNYPGDMWDAAIDEAMSVNQA